MGRFRQRRWRGRIARPILVSMQTTHAQATNAQPSHAIRAAQRPPTAVTGPAAGLPAPALGGAGRDAAHDIRVFLVEDSAPIRERLIEMLGDIPGVRIAGSAEHAAQAAADILRERPDTVVLDLRLASGSGLDVLRAVHPVAPEIAFIVLTNFANPQYRDICLAAGASHFLDKSTEIGEIKRLLAERAASAAVN